MTKPNRTGDPEYRASKGCYANYVRVGHNAFEFVLEFGQVYEGLGPRVMHTRIVTTPAYAKAMVKTLRTAIEEFEATYGELPDTAEKAQ